MSTKTTSMTKRMKLHVNGSERAVRTDPSTPLLWVLRDNLGLTGTKYGCGIAQCGACTVHVDGQAAFACVLPVSAANGRKVVTIEGLSADGQHPVQRAWLEESVSQCGYCQPGQIMRAASLLARNDNPSMDEIHLAMRSCLCRCGTYERIRRAIRRASAELREK